MEQNETEQDQDRDLVILKNGVLIHGRRYTRIRMRSATLGDQMDAEEDSTISKPVSYRTAIIARCITKIEDSNVPLVTPGMLRSISPADSLALQNKLNELELSGED